MQKIDWKKALFIKSAVKSSDYPIVKNDRGQILPEIAIAGRSNVGKSSLINDLTNIKLAKVSATPGKTQLINFFNIDKKVCLVDLPGYGFAKVPLEMRKEWGPMVQNYLESRETLKLILFLFDIRRIPNEEDLQLIEWANYSNKELVVVLTKADKVSKQELVENSKKILNLLSITKEKALHYSVPKKQGQVELKNRLSQIFKE